MPKKRKNKKLSGLILMYVIVIIIELFACVPYHRIRVDISEQSVPHVTIVGSGYSDMYHIAENYATSQHIGKRVNSQQLIVNILITTAVATVIYFTKKKNAADESECDSLKAEIDTLRKQNAQLQNTKNSLCRGKNYPTGAIHQAAKPPFLDVNSLAFADSQTILREQEKYAEEMYCYIKGRLESENEVTK